MFTQSGTVIWYNDYKGFGAIKADSGEEYSFHKSNFLEPDLAIKPGSLVNFRASGSSSRLIAVSVSLAALSEVLSGEHLRDTHGAVSH